MDGSVQQIPRAGESEGADRIGSTTKATLKNWQRARPSFRNAPTARIESLKLDFNGIKFMQSSHRSVFASWQRLAARGGFTLAETMVAWSFCGR